MGLIKAAQAATGTVMADQWKEFFYCDSLDNDTLLVRGKKRTGSRSSNTNGNDNIISNGSGIAVADGQCVGPCNIDACHGIDPCKAAEKNSVYHALCS